MSTFFSELTAQIDNNCVHLVACDEETVDEGANRRKRSCGCPGLLGTQNSGVRGYPGYLGRYRWGSLVQNTPIPLIPRSNQALWSYALWRSRDYHLMRPNLTPTEKKMTRGVAGRASHLLHNTLHLHDAINQCL